MYDLQQREWSGESWVGYHNDPLQEYEGRTELHDTPAAGNAWAEQRQKEMLAGMAKKASDVGTLINSLKAQQAADQLLPPAQRMTPEQAHKLNEDIKKTIANRKAMTDMVSDISALEARSKQGPYFHLGRDGDHFVSAHVISNNNIPDDRALVSIRDAMEHAGFGGNVLSRGVDNTSIYVRVESEAQREELFKLFHDQQVAGNIDAAKPIARGSAVRHFDLSERRPQLDATGDRGCESEQARLSAECDASSEGVVGCRTRTTTARVDTITDGNAARYFNHEALSEAPECPGLQREHDALV